MEAGIVVVIVLIVIIAVAVFVVRRRRSGEPEQEKFTSLNGQTISATVINIEEKTVLVNPTITEFARRYFIQAEWTNAENQRTYSFTSAPLPEVPAHIHVGGSVKIRLDPEDPYEYIVVLAP
jgi:heme/copper-type cytochrome/quinol oxidase subunit 2